MLLLAVCIVVPAGLARATSSPASLYAEALKERDRKQFDQAAELLRLAVARQPARIEYWLVLGETLGWARRFQEAEAVYRETVRRFPRSLEARLALGQAHLWQQNYRAAGRVYREALAAHPSSLAAREGIATAAYWIGDFRTARREFARIVRDHPSHAASLKAIAEIDQATAPAYGISTSFRRDDQPYRMSRTAVSLTLFSDEVTKWTLMGGTYTLDNPHASFDATSPFGELAVETKIAGEYDIEARARFISFPDEEERWLPALSVSRGFGAIGSVTLFYEENELLFSERALASHPSVENFGMRWSREGGSGWTAAASARALRYFDENEGFGADVWTLFPVIGRERLSLSAGAAVSYRDTDESRFRAVPGTTEGIYDPYWTPQELLEGRGVVSAAWKGKGFELHFHGDGGVARDEVVDLASGVAVTRDFNPWSVSLGARIPLGSRHELSAGLRRESTAFYVANEISAGVSGRF